MTSESRRRHILVVDDDAAVVDYLVEMLGDAGYQATGTTSPADALRRVAEATCDLVVSDIEMPGMKGLELMERIQEVRPNQLVLLITAYGSIELAVKAVRQGACDFVAKPFPIEELLLAIERAFREREMRREIVRLRTRIDDVAAGGFIARSRSMRRVVELVERAARGDSSVLITGESGVGKGAVAKLVHDRSARAAGPFVQLNCAALPATLAESELFGVRRGAYTDARESRPGLFAQAGRGTLFLDEIGEMPLEVQPKLLQALETKRVRPVGSGDEVPVDVRIVAATNRPLEEALRERRFRPDLFYRLNVIRVDIPPLRDRPEDVEALVDVFLNRAGEVGGRRVLGVSKDAMRWLLGHDWPGNVRELANRIERAVALSEHDTLVLEDVAPEAVEAGEAAGDLLGDAVDRAAPLAEVEREYIERVIAAHGGNKAQAARALGIDRRTLYRRTTTGGQPPSTKR
jgi:DNA-binding NtrC family response regulator